MANPRDVTQCLSICNGVGLEVAPGQCCWPGQQWNIDREECFGPALECMQNTRLSPRGECLTIEGPCESNLDCDPGSACLAGGCIPGHRFRRLEVFAEAVPIMLGWWSITEGSSTDSPKLASGGFASGGGMGLALRTSWAIHPRWSLGAYVGYLRSLGGRIDVDEPNALRTGSRSLSLSAVRSGGLVNYRFPAHRALAAGLGFELGFLIGTAGGGDLPFGIEAGPELFFDIPLSRGIARRYLTVSFGFRAGTMDRQADLAEASRAFEWWYYFMPVVRVGFGVGH
jgi:hypothetical protein